MTKPKIDLDHICDLAKIEIKDQDKKKYQKNLDAILTYVQKLDELDLDSIDLETKNNSLSTPLRIDENSSPLKTELSTIIKNAPAWQDNHFKVPGIIGDID
ncbi:Asp-tRNA(Asn)/Glu-tRNA(Gln) amidotransferase subunit GatC [bacterium]|jgi:aspartyl-tRNA(Asn)/glutamyl-tRNA(Gln) amidotransferase subunit C|nr:Asp-tRNA(Asn)/Glu-tRNA(Gln) amidotransferase subunit GatC [bacterium]MBT3581628.1 Asp-tRNA(Asn)/Glu-tRNA(Gln) amidotransferase subunit GatC [bacterium]MBT5988356.1 Asp-tRNA(Asn)/Glu-tRNA(Gln) amidotransferase subunit GatC [bacterium]